LSACIGVFRAHGPGLATAAALERLGYAVALAPVVEPVALAGAPPERSFALVVGASAAAFTFAGPWLARLAQTPLALVGEATLRAARSAGLSGHAQTFADAEAFSQGAGTFPLGEALYLAGRDRKSTIESVFAASQRAFVLVETYEARARPRWSAAEIAGLRACRLFVHYSRRSASLAIALADANDLLGVFAAADHICLSEDVAAPLRAQGWRAIRIAATPDQRALEAALTQR